MLNLLNAVSEKRCKIQGNVVVNTNRKSYCSCRFVPNSVTLDDLEGHNSGKYHVILTNLVVAFEADNVKMCTVVEDTATFSASEM